MSKREGEEPMKTVAVDFDGVLHSYVSGWQGETVIPDPPVPGAIEWLDTLCNDYRVVIISSRARTWRGRLAIRKWLLKHAGSMWANPMNHGPGDGIIDIRVTSEKVPAHLYIDDRSYEFRGRFPSRDYIEAFRPWKAKDKESEA